MRENKDKNRDYYIKNEERFYPNRTLRIKDDAWKKLSKLKNNSGKTWNNFIQQILETLEK